MNNLEQCRSTFPVYDWQERPTKSPIEHFVGTPPESDAKVFATHINAWGNGTLFQAEIEIRFWSNMHKLYLRSKSHYTLDGALSEIRSMIEHSIGGFQSML